MDNTPPKDFKRVPVHFVFDVKFDLRRKARLVVGGYLTKPIFNNFPSQWRLLPWRASGPASVLAELNGLSLCAADVGNAYLEACTPGETLHNCWSSEFGVLEGHTLIVHKALYGLRTSGARWAERLADSLRAQGFTVQLCWSCHLDERTGGSLGICMCLGGWHVDYVQKHSGKNQYTWEGIHTQGCGTFPNST